MLLLTFSAGTARFVIDARRVSQVIPRIPLRTLPLANPCIAGMLDFRGVPLAVVDLSMRLFGTPCTSKLSTRIMIVRIDHAGRDVPLGLIAEQVMELSRAEVGTAVGAPPDRSSPGESQTGSTQQQCLGPIVRVDGALAQWIDVNRVVPESVRLQIFDQILE